MTTENIYKYRILILDFGSQYTKLIVRRVRELHVYCELWTWNITEIQIRKFNPNGIILSGSPRSIIEKDSPRVSQYVFEAGVPILGICYGMQIMVAQLGGCVEFSDKKEFGHTQIEIKNDSILTYNIKDSITKEGNSLLDVWMSHNDKVTIIPPNFTKIASTENCPFAIIADEKRYFYGVQFHPEVTHTSQGIHILKRFVYNICRCKTSWTPIKIIENIITRIRKQVGNDKVILGISGGIDSSVAAVLLQQAIGKNLTCIFVDNGLLYVNETQQIIDILKKQFGINVIYVKNDQYFLNALMGESDPEKKRKIIGKVFMKVFNKEALKLRDIKWFAQGTIYPDVIESMTSSTNQLYTIKSHHNVGGLPKKVRMRLIEPLRELFKDEVRKIGFKLGIPHNIINRHPFPGPGLSIRILGEVKKEYCDLLRCADMIFIEELHKANLYNKVSQAFTVFLPVRSVGIMGDNRKYEWVISLRAVETIDFMTARCARLPYDFLNRVSNRIINEISGISRVVYDISSKPPSTIEWE